FHQISAWLGSLDGFLKRRNRLVDHNPGQFIFEKIAFCGPNGGGSWRARLASRDRIWRQRALIAGTKSCQRGLSLFVSALGHAQRIQTGAVFCDDGGVLFSPVRCDRVFTHRAAHGRSPEERTGYAIGEKLGMNALAEATLPNPAELNMMAQEHFKREGTGNQQNCDLR